MKKLSNVNVNELINKGYDNLSEEELMILALKGALNSYNNSNDMEKEFYESFIVKTYDTLSTEYKWIW